MKRLTTLILTLAAVHMSFAQLLVENFSFTGPVAGANGWTAHSGAGTNALTTTATSLSFPSYPSSSIDNSVVVGASGEDVNKPYTASVTSGAVYLSLLVNVSGATITTTGDYFTGHLATTTAFFGRTFVKKNADNTFEFGIGKTSGTPLYTSASYAFGTTYLIVVKYEFFTASTTDDVASLFVFSAAAPATEPTPNQTSNVGSDAPTTGLVGAILRQGTALNGVSVTVDGMRAATTWAATIPVELVSFKGQKEKAAAKLTWATASELNNAFYAIERGTDGKTFDKIGEVSGYGNSQQMRTYTYIDEKPSGSVNYYRLRQVDFDGKETVSKTVSVNFDKAASIKVYPAIATDKINVEINSDGAVDLTIVNLTGQVVKTQKVENTEGVLPISISDLPNGSYIIRMISKTGEMIQRFEKQ